MIQKLSIAKRKFFSSLSSAKARREHGLFMVEGERALSELMFGKALCMRYLVATGEWLQSSGLRSRQAAIEVFEATKVEMKQISNLVTPPDVIGVFEMPRYDIPSLKSLHNQLTLALDDVQDPGNMGTIMRLADWWGVEYILASANSVDCFNSKVVQSAMGAMERVKVCRVNNLGAFLTDAGASGLPVVGTFLDGENLFQATLPEAAIIVMGNEGNGIGAEVALAVNRRITIPSYPPGAPHVESLNVATATAIVLSKFRQRFF